MWWRNKSQLECEVCHAEFSLTSIEVRFYQQQDLPKPKRCRACRNLVASQESRDAAEIPQLLRRRGVS